VRVARLPETVLFFALLGLDRATKVVVAHGMELYQSIPLVPGFFHLTYLRNTGGAFSMLAGWDSPLRRAFFVAVSLLAFALLVWLYRKVRGGHLGVRLALAAVAAGALGNLYDRAVHGEVVDFLDLFAGSHHWPAFNVADSAISCGAVALFVLYLTGRFEWPGGKGEAGNKEG
jgi:signal peptidase II